jgi:dimeric dUTPase (all-alpha-NTP-PPase superfamily)
MINKVKTMLDLQDSINQHVHPDWRNQGFAWYRAIWTECAELMEHYGWKWWKKHKPDAQQVALELIDIWHFGLSIMLVDDVPAEEIARQLSSASESVSGADFREALEDFTLDVLATRSFDPGKFGELMALIDLSFDDLFLQYVGKNMLNRFRQDKGYKDGSYIKVWNGQEDNEVLVDVLRGADSERGDFADQVYAGLAAAYPE